MFAIVIAFTSAVDPDQLQASMAEYADQLPGIPGLIAKTWLRDGTALGSSYLFRTAPAPTYLAGPLIAGSRNAPIFSRFDIRHYDVIDDLTARIWSAPAAA